MHYCLTRKESAYILYQAQCSTTCTKCAKKTQEMDYEEMVVLIVHLPWLPLLALSLICETKSEYNIDR